jgi:4-amino-4-deoxy-L-arabinose transferase-like glycosyltransferase
MRSYPQRLPRVFKTEPFFFFAHGDNSDWITQRRWILSGILLFAMLIRIAAVAWTRSYVISPDAGHFAFGYEAGRIARSLAMGLGFASPMPFPTGPTASLPPAYPLLLSGIFRLFGIYTPASAWAAYAFNALASALTCLVLYRLGSVIFGEAAGLVAAALFALYPNSIWFAAGTIWDTSLVALCLPTLLLWFYLLPFDPPPAKMVLTGLWTGLLSFINPIVSIAGLVGLCWIWIRLRRAGPARHWKPGLALFVCFLAMLPWMVRNAAVVGEFSPRGFGGLNLWLGNNEATWKAGNGMFPLAIYPANSAAEAKRFQELGEGAYDRERGRQAIAFIRHNPGRFITLVGMRIQSWWIGYDSNFASQFHGLSNPALCKRLLGSLWLPFFLAGAILAARRARPAYPLLATILLFPLPYYATIVSERYRFPSEPLILVFVAYCLTALWKITRKRPPMWGR